jgi:hypothetical protein
MDFTPREGMDAIEAWNRRASLHIPIEAGNGGDGWLPIETAPRNGTAILGSEPDSKYPQAMIWKDYSEYDAEETGQKGYWEYAESLIGDFNGAAEPTHWRSLPSPPSPSNEGEKA